MLILVDRRNNVLELYNQFEVKNQNFSNKVRAVLNELPFEVKHIDSEIVIEICKRLGLVWNATKWKVEALKNHNKVTLTLRSIFKQDSKKVKKQNEKVMLDTNIGQVSVGDDFLSSSRVMETGITINEIPEHRSLLLKPNLEESTVDGFITPTKQNEAIFTMGCVNDIMENISQVENLITDKYTPKKKVMCGSNAEQLSVVDETLYNFRLIQRNENTMEVASIYSSSVENMLDTSSDTVLMEPPSPKESNFVFVTPTQRHFTTGTPKRKLFHDNITGCSLFESNYSIDLLRNTGKTRDKFISPIKSPLKRLNDRHFNKSPGELLPHGSKNVSPLNIEGEYYECNFKEGEFIIPKDEWNHIFEDGKLNTKRYPGVFRKHLQAVNNTCILYIKKLEYIKTEQSMKLKMYCKHSGCKKFKLHILPTGDKAIVKVYSTSKNFNHKADARYTTQIRGVERKIIAEKIKEKSAFKYRQECVLSVSPIKLIKCGNLQTIKSPSMLRKLNSEQQLKGDFNRNDHFDVVLMAKEHPWLNMKVPENIEEPFSVTWASQQQLAIVESLFKKGGLTTIHVDSTGSVVRPPQNSTKLTIYYYACVVRIGKIETVCPITDMVSATHDRETVTEWLKCLKELVIAKDPSVWPPFKNVVTDFSWAFMHGISKAWNDKETIFEYLDMCHRILTGRETLSSCTVVITSCTNHYVKNILNHVKRYYPDDEKTAFYIARCVGLVFEMKNYEEIKHWFKLLTTMILSDKSTEMCKTASMEMKSYLRTNHGLVETEIEKFDDDQNYSCGKTTDTSYYAERKKSAFYHDFKQIFDSVKKIVNIPSREHDHLDVNSMYSEEYLLHFLIENVPYIPLWTKVMTNIIHLEERQSNASVESWFNLVKNHILAGQRRMKCGRFIEKITQYEAQCFRQIELQIPKRICAMNKKADSDEDNLHLNTPETWRKKGKRPAFLRNNNKILGKNYGENLQNCSSLNIQCPDRTLEQGVVLHSNDDEFINDHLTVCRQTDQPFVSSLDIGEQFDIVSDISDHDCVLTRENSESPKIIENMNKTVVNTTPVASITQILSDTYGHAVVWESSTDKSPIGNYNLYRTNKLVKDPMYYMESYRGVDKYVVSQISFENEEIEISSLDFLSLNTKGDTSMLWLHNKEIWCLLQIFLERNSRSWITKKKQQLGCVSPEQSYYMFNLSRSVEDSTASRPEWIDSSRLLIPLLEKDHWTLIYIDFIKKTVSYLNSIESVHTNIEKRNYWKDRVLNVLCDVPKTWKPKQNVGDINKWKDMFVQIPYQDDGFNCGVFMLYFANQLMSNKRIINVFNPNSYRSNLQDLILSSSKCMKNICLICGKDEGSFRQNYNCEVDSTMVQCGSCTRWLHISCLPEIEQKEFENSDWVCGLCSNQCPTI
ncbi:hypothetical protein ACI65C_003461 [Semiaphis heraclei]